MTEEIKAKIKELESKKRSLEDEIQMLKGLQYGREKIRLMKVETERDEVWRLLINVWNEHYVNKSRWYTVMTAKSRESCMEWIQKFAAEASEMIEKMQSVNKEEG